MNTKALATWFAPITNSGLSVSVIPNLIPVTAAAGKGRMVLQQIGSCENGKPRTSQL